MIRRRGELVLALAVAVLILAFWKFRLSDPAVDISIESGDVLHQIYPMWVRAAELMRHGEIPLWNPYQMCGQPFLASVLYGVFYPLNVARLVVSTALAIEVTIVLHLFLAWCFMYLYARHGLGVGRIAATASAFAFALSGFVVFEQVWFMPAGGAAIWLPLAFLAVDKLFAERHARWVVLLGIAVAMPILAGWLQTWLHSMQAIALYSIVRAALLPADRRRVVPSVAVYVVAGVLLGGALAAVQWLPSLELQRLGWRRPGGLSFDQQLAMGVEIPEHLWAQAVTVTRGFPQIAHVGIATLILVPLSLVLPMRSRGQVLAFWAIVLWGLGVALVATTPLFTIYRWLPAGTWFRIPARILFLSTFGCAALAAIALDGLGSELAVGRKAVVGLLAIAISVAVLCTGSGWKLVLYVVVIAVAVAGMILSSRARPYCAAAIVLVLVTDLFLVTWVMAARPYQNSRAFDEQAPLFDFIKQHQGYYRTYFYSEYPFHPSIMSKQGTLRQIFMITDYEILSLRRMQEYCDAMAAKDPKDDKEPFIGICVATPATGTIALLDRMSTHYAIVPADAPRFAAFLGYEGWWKKMYQKLPGPYDIFENPHPVAHAYVAYDPAITDDPDAALRFVADGNKSSAAVILEQDAQHSLPATAASPMIKTSPAEIVRYEPTTVEIEARASAPGYLVLTDTFYPGWRAYVDGARAPVFRANYLFRAVPVPAGKHRVTFRFVSLTFEVGAAVSIAAIVAIAGTFAIRRRRV